MATAKKTARIEPPVGLTNEKMPEASLNLRNIALYQLSEAARQNGLAIETIAFALSADAPLFGADKAKV